MKNSKPPYFKIKGLLLLLMLLPCIGLCQGLEEKSLSNSQSLLESLKSDIQHVAISPYTLVKEHPAQLVAFTGFSLGLVHYGDQFFDRIYAHHEYRLLPDDAAIEPGRFYDRIGPSNMVFGLTGAGLAGGFIFKDRKLLQTSRLMLESILITRGITVLGKAVFGRNRPHSNAGAMDFNLMQGHSSHKLRSMPSLHTSNIFAAMTVIAKQYDYLAVDIGAYGFATSVALQRTASRSHWLSDVFIGGAIGYFIGDALVDNNRTSLSKNVSFKPFAKANRIGIALEF